MGTLERDNYPFMNTYNNETQFRKDDASALASVDRSRPSKMLGGEDGLERIMKSAKTTKSESSRMLLQELVPVDTVKSTKTCCSDT